MKRKYARGLYSIYHAEKKMPEIDFVLSTRLKGLLDLKEDAHCDVLVMSVRKNCYT